MLITRLHPIRLPRGIRIRGLVGPVLLNQQVAIFEARQTERKAAVARVLRPTKGARA